MITESRSESCGNLFILIALISLGILTCCRLGFADDGIVDHEYQLAFAANLDGNWDLFVSTLDGQEVKRLTESPWDEFDPDWSPDGRYVAVSTTGDNIGLIEVASGAVTYIKASSAGVRYAQPRFAPNGTTLACTIHDKTKVDVADIGLYDMQESMMQPLPDQPSLQLFPSWSPDGRRLLYTFTSCSRPCGRVIQELWQYDIQNAALSQLFMTNSHCQSPRVSADGHTLVFVSDMNGQFDLWTIKLDGSSPIQLTDDAALEINPTWLPDGSGILFSAVRDELGFQIYTVDITSKEIVHLAILGNDTECKDPDVR